MGETSRFESQQTREVKEGVENMIVVESGESKGGEEEREPLSLKKQRNPRPDKMLLSKYHVSKCFQSNIRSSVFGAVNRKTKRKVVLKSSQYNEATHEVYRSISESSQHEGLLRPIEYFLDREKRMQIVLPFIKGGDLIEEILHSGPMAENEVRKRMRSVVTGLKYLHEVVRVAHRDISPENVLLDETQTILMDYGSCRRIVDKTCDNISGVKLVYLAPELFKQHASSDASLCDLRKSDVWSLGCVIFVALFGIPPFESASRGDERFRHLQEYGFLSYLHAMMGPRLDISDTALDLLQAMLHPNPESRPTCTDILAHSWFEI